MSIRQVDLNTDNAFENCKLDRKKYADALTSIVSTYADGFVLAVNNSWGTGKTTFVKMWQNHLDNNNFKTIYFNAWENDFNKNPLAAIVSEFSSLSKNSKNTDYSKLIEAGAAITKSAVVGGAKTLAARIIGSEATGEIVSKMTESVLDGVFKDALKNYKEAKQGIVNFRKHLESYVSKFGNDGKKDIGDGKPLIFIIDELDRCRPDYAVEVLEILKHLFCVPGIVFVLSIDKVHLSCAIKGYYGSSEFDARDYLRRFIDLEYVLPNPSTEAYCNYLYDKYQFEPYFSKRNLFSVPNITHSIESKDNFISYTTALFEHHKFTLRQQEKIFINAKVALSGLHIHKPMYPTVYMLLLFIRFHSQELFLEIVNSKHNIREVLKNIYNILPSIITAKDDNSIIYTLSLFTVLYNRYRFLRTKTKVVLYTSDGTSNPTINISLPNHSQNDLTKQVSEKFQIFIFHIGEYFNNDGIQTELQDLLSAIDLTQQIQY
ncbi:MAG: P-loop NTPase fold protein [Candidatus Kapaibacterium sp.]